MRRSRTNSSGGLKFYIIGLNQDGANLSFAENGGDDPFVFEVLGDENARLYKEHIKKRIIEMKK